MLTSCLSGESVAWNIIFSSYLKLTKCLKHDYSIFCTEGITITRLDMSRDFTVRSLPMTVEVVHKINTCLATTLAQSRLSHVSRLTLKP